MTFEWDESKNLVNTEKHGVSFGEAQYAFADPFRLIQTDTSHSSMVEQRYYCFGKLKERVVTVRFTLRGDSIRIFGAGYWRKGARIYEDR